jgi:hypothetical protein
MPWGPTTGTGGLSSTCFRDGTGFFWAGHMSVVWKRVSLMREPERRILEGHIVVFGGMR